MIRTVCPNCAKGLKSTDDWDGRVVSCPNCGGEVTVGVVTLTSVTPSPGPAAPAAQPAQPWYVEQLIPCRVCRGRAASFAPLCPHCFAHFPNQAVLNVFSFLFIAGVILFVATLASIAR